MTNPSHSFSYEERLQAAKAFIEQRDEFMVVSHIHPDGDAISSSLGIGWLLQQLDKSYVVINEGAVPGKMRYLRNSESIVNYSVSGMKTSYDHIISVDCADFSRIGSVSSCFNEGAQLLNIDHHPTNNLFGHENLVWDKAAATVEIVYDLACLFGVKWHRDFAECIYTGLLTDTGGFRYSNTSPCVLQIASEMLSYGVQGNVLSERLLESMTYPQFMLMQRSLSGMTFSSDRKLAYICVTLEDLQCSGATDEDTEGLVNYARNIEGVEVGILFKEQTTDEIKVSMRSTGTVDVSQIAQSLGGGGHARAAGCSLQGPLQVAIETMVRKVGSVLHDI